MAKTHKENCNISYASAQLKL